jgi:hypothetical protein
MAGGAAEPQAVGGPLAALLHGVLLELASGRAALVLLGACAVLYVAERLFSRRGLRLGLAFSELVVSVALVHAAMALAVPSEWLGDRGRAGLSLATVFMLGLLSPEAAYSK